MKLWLWSIILSLQVCSGLQSPLSLGLGILWVGGRAAGCHWGDPVRGGRWPRTKQARPGGGRPTPAPQSHPVSPLPPQCARARAGSERAPRTTSAVTPSVWAAAARRTTTRPAWPAGITTTPASACPPARPTPTASRAGAAWTATSAPTSPAPRAATPRGSWSTTASACRSAPPGSSGMAVRGQWCSPPPLPLDPQEWEGWRCPHSVWTALGRLRAMGPLQRASITDILYEILKRSSWPPPQKKTSLFYVVFWKCTAWPCEGSTWLVGLGTQRSQSPLPALARQPSVG